MVTLSHQSPIRNRQGEYKHRERILRELQSGFSRDAIVRSTGADPELVEAIDRARRWVRAMLNQGCSPKVLYGNFADLLTQKACGL